MTCYHCKGHGSAGRKGRLRPWACHCTHDCGCRSHAASALLCWQPGGSWRIRCTFRSAAQSAASHRACSVSAASCAATSAGLAEHSQEVPMRYVSSSLLCVIVQKRLPRLPVARSETLNEMAQHAWQMPAKLFTLPSGQGAPTTQADFERILRRDMVSAGYMQRSRAAWVAEGCLLAIVACPLVCALHPHWSTQHDQMMALRDRSPHIIRPAVDPFLVMTSVTHHTALHSMRVG